MTRAGQDERLDRHAPLRAHRARPGAEAGVDLRQGAGQGAGAPASQADHGRVPDRGSAARARAGGLQPERVGPDARLDLLGATDPAGHGLHTGHLARGRARRRGGRRSGWTRYRRGFAGSAISGSRCSRPAAASGSRRCCEPAAALPVPADGSRERAGAARGPRMAVRAQVGRLPLPRLPRRGDGSAAEQGRQAAGPVLPRRGRVARRARGRALRAGRRDRDPGGRPALVRRAAAAGPSRGEPGPHAGGGAPRAPGGVRPPGGRAGSVPRRAVAGRATRAARGLRQAVLPSPRAIVLSRASRRATHGPELARAAATATSTASWPSGSTCRTGRASATAWSR